MGDKKIVVIGGGPGGYYAAILASQLGGKVTLIEKDALGGTCTNRGCIPTKVILESASLLSRIKECNKFGINVQNIKVNYKKIVQRKNEIVKQMSGGVATILKKNKVEIISGKAIIKDVKTVGITGSDVQVETDNIIIATGSVPTIPLIDGINEENVMNSDDALEMQEIPKSLAIIGGGYVGVEFAQMLNDLGCRCTIIEMMENILPTVDSEIANIYARHATAKGIEIIVDAKVKKITRTKTAMKVAYQTKEGKKEKQVQKVIVAIGRKPVINKLGIEHIGIKTENGRIVVDRSMETNVKGIYAIGDVTGGIMLAHVAMAEAKCAIKNVFNNDIKMDYNTVPNCVYTTPEIASVGLSENEAKKEYENIKVSRFPYIANGKAVILGETDGEIKIIADKRYGEIYGVHIIGPHATELIAELAMAKQMEITTDMLSEIIHPHPTVSEGIVDAALGLTGAAIHI